MPGPVPKRSDLRRRRNAPAREILRAPGHPVVVPDPDPDWHPMARDWYQSLVRSGQSVYYQNSDWATAYLIAESLSRDLKPQFVDVSNTGEVIERVIPIKGASLTAYLRAMAVLLVTEGDRRRLHVELSVGDDQEEENRVVEQMSKYRRLAVGR